MTDEKEHKCSESESWECCYHWNTEYIKCPQCGAKDKDSFERSAEGDEECGDCGCKFSHQRHIEVTYSTEIL